MYLEENGFSTSSGENKKTLSNGVETHENGSHWTITPQPLERSENGTLHPAASDAKFLKEDWFDQTEAFLDDLLEKTGAKKSCKKKTMNVFLELGENILKYQISEAKPVSISVNNDSQNIFIKTSNVINTEGKTKLEETLSKINELFEDPERDAKETLKEWKKIKQNNGKFNEHGGAGLGFLKIAIQSGSKIEFSFKPTEIEGLYILNLATQVPLEFKEEKRDPAKEVRRKTFAIVENPSI